MSDLNTSKSSSTWSNRAESSTEHPNNVSICANTSSSILNNSVDTSDIQTDQQLNQIYNPTKIMKGKLDENENVHLKAQLKLLIPQSSYRIVDDLRKDQTPDVERNSTQLITEEIRDAFVAKPNKMSLSKDNLLMASDDLNKQKQARPIMGRNALLKKANIDRCDSVIIQDIILDKYNPVLTHYVSRMYHRRLSKTRLDSSSEDVYSDVSV